MGANIRLCYGVFRILTEWVFKVKAFLNEEILLCEGNLSPVCKVACYEHRFIGARSEKLMGSISPAALLQAAGECNIAAVYSQVGLSVIRSQLLSR